MPAFKSRLRSRREPPTPEPERSRPLTPAKAVDVLGTELPLTVSMLRVEIRAGNLAHARVAGKLFVTADAVRDLFRPRSTLPSEPRRQRRFAPVQSAAAAGSAGVSEAEMRLALERLRQIARDKAAAERLERKEALKQLNDRAGS